MITISDVQSKYRHLKYQHIKKIYDKNLSKIPNNCKYNKQIKLPNLSKLNICSFNLEDSFEVDLCYKLEHSKNCNAFCPIKTKEQLYSDFMASLSDDKERATLFKDINTLFWVYPNLKDEDLYKKETIKEKIYQNMLKIIRMLKKIIN